MARALVVASMSATLKMNAKAKALNETEIADRLVALNANSKGSDSDRWALVDGKLQRTFQFRDFVTAFGFMTQVALVAERLDHHPEWFNVYRRVRVDLTTHDAGGISPKDFELATAMDTMASALMRT